MLEMSSKRKERGVVQSVAKKGCRRWPYDFPGIAPALVDRQTVMRRLINPAHRSVTAAAKGTVGVLIGAKASKNQLRQARGGFRFRTRTRREPMA